MGCGDGADDDVREREGVRGIEEEEERGRVRKRRKIFERSEAAGGSVGKDILFCSYILPSPK